MRGTLGGGLCIDRKKNNKQMPINQLPDPGNGTQYRQNCPKIGAYPL